MKINLRKVKIEVGQVWQEVDGNNQFTIIEVSPPYAYRLGSDGKRGIFTADIDNNCETTLYSCWQLISGPFEIIQENSHSKIPEKKDMSWHPECYNKEHGTHVRGSPSKYSTRCEAGGKCLFGGQITTSQKYCVSSFKSNWKPIAKDATKTSTSNASTSNASTFNTMQAAFEKSVPQASTNETAPIAMSYETAKELALTLKLMKMQGQQNLTQGIFGKSFDQLESEVNALLKGIPCESENTETETEKTEEAAPPEMKFDIIKVRDVELSKDQEAKLAANVTSRLLPIMKQNVDDAIKEKSQEMSEKITLDIIDRIAELSVTKVEVHNAKTNTVKDMGLQHKQFPLLLKAVSAKVNVWLAGPSGSGKTTAAQNVSEALGLPFHYTGAVGDPYALLGYNDANGKYVRTVFRDAWENGGVFLWDEVDASHPNALLAFNAALANAKAPFPDRIVDKHPDCVLIAAANTWGFGATNEYVGRLKMDAAFLKRFAFISWDYDEQLELATAPNKEWTMRVQQIRKKVRDKGVRVMVTPRESYIGAQLLAAGIPQNQVEEMTIRSGMTAEQWKEISSTGYVKPLY